VYDFDDAFLSLKAVNNAAMYQGAENTHPHRAPFRYKGMPNDSFHIAYTGHYTRLQNKLKPIGIDPDEQILTELRRQFVNLRRKCIWKSSGLCWERTKNIGIPAPPLPKSSDSLNISY
jgi:hypothetical protein